MCEYKNSHIFNQIYVIIQWKIKIILQQCMYFIIKQYNRFKN